MNGTCTECAAGPENDRSDHCHGTLIRHEVLAFECTDPQCASPVEVRHRLVIDCVELGDCACTVRATEFRQAS
ncbi:hypothetical protein HCA44_17175 [Rhodococcus sp. HNM0569]|nr:hypothetical protein [Rhodococcus sp. HNM0569]